MARSTLRKAVAAPGAAAGHIGMAGGRNRNNSVARAKQRGV
jgi:hypothetical protein